MRSGRIYSLILILIFPLISIQAASQTRLEYSQPPNIPIMEFNQFHDELAEPVSIPRVRVFSSGLVKIHFPVFMKKSGDYEIRLAQDELDDLVEGLIRSSLLDFDEVELRAEFNSIRDNEMGAIRAGNRVAGVEIQEVADETVTYIRLSLQRYRKSNGEESQNAEKEIFWRGLKSDAARYSQIETIQNLAELEMKLKALSEREDLIRVSRPEENE